MAASQLIDAYVGALPGSTRRLSDSQWGITVDAEHAGGWPLDVGLRLDEGLLRIQAFVLPAREDLNPWNLLHWNRQTRLVRYGCTRSGDIWAHADLPAAAVDEKTLDRLLGLVAEAAVALRAAVTAEPAEPSGWLPG